MKKFGFGKKGDGDEDSNRLALFGSKSKSKSPAPPANNPYAAIPPDAYTQAKMKAGIVAPPPVPSGPQGAQGSQGSQGPNGYGASAGGYGNTNRPPPSQQQQSFGNNRNFGPPQGLPQGPQGGYGGNMNDNQGYGPNKFGNEKGYGGAGNGGNPYAGYSQASGTSRQGGYGGLGKPDNFDDPGLNEEKNALFGGAKERIQEKQQSGPPPYDYEPATDPSEPRSYGAYGDRQLTAEEEEEEDIQATKQEIKFMKQSDVASTRNALRMAAMAEETGRNTLARLGAQGERLHNTNRNLDIANNHINIAEDKAKELKTLNRSMFAVHVNNPFTSKDRRIQREEKIVQQHESERLQREATRETAFKANQRMNQNFKSLGDSYTPTTYKPNLAERAKYQFEADSDDERMEDEIDRNIDELSGAAKRLNLLARATGEEVDAQNKIIRGIAEKSDSVDTRVHLQTERLKRIK